MGEENCARHRDGGVIVPPSLAEALIRLFQSGHVIRGTRPNELIFNRDEAKLLRDAGYLNVPEN